MRYPRVEMPAVRQELIGFTGGVNEAQSQYELSPGELITSSNYMEVDGPARGYVSLNGYERYDGTALASSVNLIPLEDTGHNGTTVLLVEANSTLEFDAVTEIGTCEDFIGPTELGTYKVTEVSESLLDYTDTAYFIENHAGGLYINPDNLVDLADNNFTIDLRFKPHASIDTTRDSYLIYKSGAFAVYWQSEHTVYFENATAAVAIGDVVVGTVSGMEGKVTLASVVTSGSYGGGDAAGFFKVVHNVTGATGTYDATDDLEVLTVKVAEVSATPPDTALYLRYYITDTTLTQHSATTFLRLNTSEEYHLGISGKWKSGSLYVRAFANGRALYNKSTFALAELVSANPVDTNSNFLSIGSASVGSTTGSIYGYLNEIRIEVGSYKYFGSVYDVPTIPYTDDSYFQINFDDREREIERLSINPVPGVTSGLSGLAYYTKDRSVYTKNSQSTGSLASIWRSTSSGWVLVDNTLNQGGTLRGVEWRIDGYQDVNLVLILVDGVSPPRIWNGTTMTVLTNAVTGDPTIDEIYTNYGIYPTRATVWANRLVLGYDNGYVIMSANFDPTDFAGGFGADAVSGDTLTGFADGPDDTLIIFMRDSIKICYSGVEGSADFAFHAKTFSRTSGAIADTPLRGLADIYYADDAGFTSFKATDTYGDFTAVSISKKINKTYQKKKGLVTAALIDRGYNQYRLFFSDNSGIIFTFNVEGKLLGATLINYNHAVLSTVTGEDANGNIVKFFSTNNNFVYKMDSGSSFDGSEVVRWIETGYHSYKSPEVWKRFKRIVLETSVEDYILALNVNFSFDYSDSFIHRPFDHIVNAIINTSAWGFGIWGTFVWKVKGIAERVSRTFSGYGSNMSIKITHSSKYYKQHTIHNAIVEYTLGTRRRR